MQQYKNKKFVVVKPHYGDVYNFCYKDLEDLENVDLLNSYITFDSKLEEKLYYKHFTDKMWLPFRGIWNKKYFKNKFNKNDEVYFILCNIPHGVYKYGIVERLKKKYKNSKIVLFLNDLVKNNFKSEKDKEVLKKFDKVLSFDYNDCLKYGFEYHPLVYSAPKYLSSNTKDIDVFFCGKDKNRFDLILKIYDTLTSKNIKCNFLVHGVPLEKRVDREGITYLEKFMSYEENLKYLNNCKCILEIMQENGNGYTLRTCEAVAYNKKILTNNSVLKDSDIYEENMISFFKTYEDIDIDFIYNTNGVFKDRHYFSPRHLLEKVVNIFENSSKE